MIKQGNRTPIDPGEKQNEAETWIEKDGFKTGFWHCEIVETF